MKKDKRSLLPRSKKKPNNPKQGNYPVLYFNISLAGSLHGDAGQRTFQRIESLLREIIDAVKPFDQNDYGFKGEGTVFQALFNPNTFHMPLAKVLPTDFNPICVTPSTEIYADRDRNHAGINRPIATVNFNIPQVNLNYCAQEIDEWMIEQSDLIILLWDGTKEYENGKTWSLIQESSVKNVPVIWINPLQPDEIFWCRNCQSSIYTPEDLTGHINTILGAGKNPEKQTELHRLILPDKKHKPLWADYYKNYIKRFKFPPAEQYSDPLVEGNLPLPECYSSFREKFSTMMNHYREADDTAILYNNFYRSTLLLRAILPFAANLALAVGFYAKTLGGYVFFPFNISWEWIALVGFLLQATCNVSISLVSDHNNRRGWHKVFVDQRYIAEALRLAIHFSPVNIAITNIATSGYASQLPADSPVSHRLRGILRAASINPVSYNGADEKEFFFTHTGELIKDQVFYHRFTAEKFKRIFTSLNRSAWIMFFVSLATVIGRGVLQIVMQSVDINQLIPAHEFFIGLKSVSVDGKTFLASFANMLALLMPAITATLFSILGLCGFKDLYLRSEQMAINLQQLSDQLEHEEKRPHVSYDDYCRLAKQVITLLLRDTTDWYTLVTSKKITKN